MQFEAAQNARLILVPGFRLSGSVMGDYSGTDVVELASAASAGTLAGPSAQFQGKWNLAFDAGARWTVKDSAAGFNGSISGFAVGDTIEVTGQTATGSSFSAGLLFIAGTPVALDVGLGFTSASQFRVTNVAAGVDITVACFAAGTRIETSGGPVAIENLREGDRVVSAFGGTAPVRWVGYRRINCRRHPRRRDVWPVRVAAGAIAPGTPAHDLILSPDHAVYLDGVLIPVRYLLNGASIAQEECDTVTYWHVELPAHDVILAEGLPAESYLDTGNRAAFANGGAVAMLHADFALRVWEAEACAPLVTRGLVLVAAQARLLARAQTLGHRLTDDPDLRLIVDGRELAPMRTGSRFRYILPPSARHARLLSRSFVPADVFPGSGDHRPLGVAITDLQGGVAGDGWHTAEAGLRWTNGDAVLVLSGAHELAFTLVPSGAHYWECPPIVTGLSRNTPSRPRRSALRGK